MGVRLPGGEHDPVQLRRRRGAAWASLPGIDGNSGKQDPSGGPEATECLGPVRHARERLGVVLGRVRARTTIDNRPAPTRSVPRRPPSGCTGAGAGAAARGSPGRRAGAGTRRATGAATWGSAWPESSLVGRGEAEPGAEAGGAQRAEPPPRRAGAGGGAQAGGMNLSIVKHKSKMGKGSRNR